MGKRKEKRDIKVRLQTYLETIGMSINRLEVLAGFTNRYLNNVQFQVPLDKIQRILEVLPDLNGEWLLDGEGEMTNNLLTDASSPVGIEYREAVLDRLDMALRANGFHGLAEYENYAQKRPGSIAKSILTGDDRLVLNTVYSAIGRYQGFSLDWVLYGNGVMRIGATAPIPVVHAASIIEKYATNERRGGAPEPETPILIPEPSSIIPGWTDSGKAFNGFLFIVPAMNGYKHPEGNDLSDEDVRPAFANSTTMRLFPGDALLCEICAGDLDKGDPYLFLLSETKMVACAVYEESGFRVDEPASDYFGTRYQYFPPDNVVVLGKVIRKATSHLDH